MLTLAIANGITIVGKNPIEVTRKSTYVGICKIRFIKDVIEFMINPITALIKSTIARSKPIILIFYLWSKDLNQEEAKNQEQNQTEY